MRWRISVLQNEGFLSVKQAASLLGVSPNTVRAWGAEGKVPEYRHPLNNYRLYRRAELDEILRNLEQSRSPALQATGTQPPAKRRAK